MAFYESEAVTLKSYNTLRDLLRRVTAERDACAQMNDDQARRVFAAEAELAETKRLLVEAREEGRREGLREAAEMVEMTDLSKVADPSWKLFFADMFIQIAANIRASEGK
jgi:hypothetical protein